MALLTFEEDMEIQRRMLEEDREDFEIQKRILEEDRGDFEIQKRTLEEQQRALEEDLEKQKHALEEQKRVLEEQRRMLQEDLDKQEHIAVEAAESEGRTEGLEAGEARLGALIAALTNLAAQKRWHSLQPMPMLAVHDSRNSASRKSFLALTSPLHVRRTRASEGPSSDARGSPGAER